MLLENKCRTCYRDVSTGESYVLTPPQGDSQTSINLAAKLKHCVPEIELDAMREEKMCWTCCVTLDKTYEFRVTCLETNEKFVNINNLHTDVDLVKTEIEDLDIKQEIENDVVVDERPFEVDVGEEEVIKGDISVGFEITKAKDVHNTVSVSITTSGTEIKTFNKKHSFANSFSGEGAKLKVIEDTHEVKTGEGGDDEVESAFKIDCVDKLLVAGEPNGDGDVVGEVNCNLEVQPLGSRVSKALEQKQSVYVCTFCDAIFSTRLNWKKHTNRHKRKMQQEAKFRKNEEPKKKLEAKAKTKDGSPELGFNLRSETVTRSKSRLAESIPKPKEVSRRPNTRNARLNAIRKIEPVADKRRSKSEAKPKVEAASADMACVFCKINFHSANIYKIHMKFIHRIDVANVESKPDAVKPRVKVNKEDRTLKSCVVKHLARGRSYHCSFCGSVLFSQQGFAGHCKTHRHHKKCEFCAREFTHMKQYLDHQVACVKDAEKATNKAKDVKKSAAVSDVVKKNIGNVADTDRSTTTNLKRKVTRSSKNKETDETEEILLNPPKRRKTNKREPAEADAVNHVVRTRSKSRRRTLEYIENVIGIHPLTNTSSPEESKSKTKITVNQSNDEANVDKVVPSTRRDRKKSPTVSRREKNKVNKSQSNFAEKLVDEVSGDDCKRAKTPENCTNAEVPIDDECNSSTQQNERLTNKNYSVIEPKTCDSNSNVFCMKNVSDSESSTAKHQPRKDDLGEIVSETVSKDAENTIDLNKICEFCLVSFDTAECLKAHVCLGMSMEEDQMYRCAICGALFGGQQTFMTHTKTAHLDGSC